MVMFHLYVKLFKHLLAYLAAQTTENCDNNNNNPISEIIKITAGEDVTKLVSNILGKTNVINKPRPQQRAAPVEQLLSYREVAIPLGWNLDLAKRIVAERIQGRLSDCHACHCGSFSLTILHALRRHPHSRPAGYGTGDCAGDYGIGRPDADGLKFASWLGIKHD